MKEELLKIAQESLSSEEVEVIVKDKFMKALGSAIDDAFRWGDAKKAIENKVKEVMVPYIESYDFSEYLPKLDSVLTEIVNSDFCIANKKVLENFKNLMLEPERRKSSSLNYSKHGLSNAKQTLIRMDWMLSQMTVLIMNLLNVK